MNKVGLLEYAQLFARHIDDESQARRLRTHVSDDRPWTNHVSRVLYTFIHTHEQTELDVKLGEFLPLLACLRGYSDNWPPAAGSTLLLLARLRGNPDD